MRSNVCQVLTQSLVWEAGCTAGHYQLQLLGSPALRVGGGRKLGEAESLFRVTKLLSQVCLNLPNSTDLGGKGEQQGKKGERV